MSAKNIQLIRIAVTGGDAIENNRLTGKSNTGTYFICSSKDWDRFEMFFKPNCKYFLDLNRIKAYKKVFSESFFKIRNLYPDSMKHFEDICDSLLSYSFNPEVFIELRNNDVRVFMKFVDNTRDIERSLRGILYSELSNLVFELNGNTCLLYPEVNFECEQFERLENDIQ